MKYTLQRELLEAYYSDSEAHDASGREENEAIENSELSYHGQPVKMLYLPKAFTEDGLAIVRSAGETMWQILVKVMRQYIECPEYRALFGFSEELEELILNLPGYDCLLPLCRLDIFWNEKSGDFAFCEFNADGASAMNENRVMGQLFARSKICRNLKDTYEIEEFELFDSWVRTFLAICRQDPRLNLRLRDVTREKSIQENIFGQPEDVISSEDYDPVSLPNVAIVDFLENAINLNEFDCFVQAFRRAGCQARIAEIRDLSYDGEKLYTRDGMRVDAIYRRAVTSDIMDHREEIEDFISAVRDKKVTLVGDFATQIVHDKILFRILHQEETMSFLTAEENLFIMRHVPFTAILGPIHANRDDIRRRFKEWIIKPEDSYGAEGIFYSGNMKQEDWEKTLDACCGQGYIIQEYIEPYRTLNADYSKTSYEGNDYQEQALGQKSPYIHSFANMTGLYLYGGRLAGIYSRLSPLNIISVEGDEHEMVSVLVRPRGKEK